MNKVLVKLFLPAIDKQYDVWISVNRRIYDTIWLLIKGVNELNDGIYEINEVPMLYNRANGEYYDINALVKNTDIKNKYFY